MSQCYSKTTNFTLIIYIGNCLEATVGMVIEHNCENFVSGCPNDIFFDYGFYTCKYSKQLFSK